MTQAFGIEDFEIFFLIAEVGNNSYETDGMVQVKTRIFFFLIPT